MQHAQRIHTPAFSTVFSIVTHTSLILRLSVVAFSCWDSVINSRSKIAIVSTQAQSRSIDSAQGCMRAICGAMRY